MIDLQFFASTLLVRITRGYLTESLLHLLYEGVVFHAKPFLLAKISRKLFRARSVLATLCTWRCTTANHYRWVPLIVRTTILKQRLSRGSGVKMKYVTTCRSRLCVYFSNFEINATLYYSNLVFSRSRSILLYERGSTRPRNKKTTPRTTNDTSYAVIRRRWNRRYVIRK